MRQCVSAIFVLLKIYTKNDKIGAKRDNRRLHESDQEQKAFETYL